MTALVPVSAAAIERLDPAAREVAVTAYLTDARDRLALALDATGPAAVAALNAEIATAAEATKQLGLSKEIQTDAIEMVRRAEFALGKAIRAGQERREIRRPGQGGGVAVPGVRGSVSRTSAPHEVDLPPSPTDFASPSELSGADGDGIYAMVDDVTEPQFDAAISDAKAEGNLSRANVVRKIKGVQSEGLTPVERLTKIRELAPTGMTSGQIAAELGLSEGYVRDRARENSIVIKADELLRGTHRLKVDSQHIAAHAVMTLEVLAAGLRQINYDDLDESLMNDWADSLSKSLPALKGFASKIKEKAQ